MKNQPNPSKGEKRTTYSLDWDTVMGLESRLLRDFVSGKGESKGMELLMVSIGVRLSLEKGFDGSLSRILSKSDITPRPSSLLRRAPF